MSPERNRLQAEYDAASEQMRAAGDEVEVVANAIQSAKPADAGKLETRLAKAKQVFERRERAAQAAADRLELYDKIAKLVGGLPRIDWGTLHALGDELAGAANEQRFEMFYDLLLDLLARLIRAKASGEGTQPDLDVARRVIDDARLASWAETWETVVREKADALALNLDRKTLILDAFSRLESVARR